jgi:hypothetical protein
MKQTPSAFASRPADDGLSEGFRRPVDPAWRRSYVTRVIFKEEDTLHDGQPIGPVTVLHDADALAAAGAHRARGRPFRPACTCELHIREGEPGEECGNCGCLIREPWKTLSEAKEIAAREGVELEVT